MKLTDSYYRQFSLKHTLKIFIYFLSDPALVEPPMALIWVEVINEHCRVKTFDLLKNPNVPSFYICYLCRNNNSVSPYSLDLLPTVAASISPPPTPNTHTHTVPDSEALLWTVFPNCTVRPSKCKYCRRRNNVFYPKLLQWNIWAFLSYNLNSDHLFFSVFLHPF